VLGHLGLDGWKADEGREDADSRVTILKQRMEMLKKRREGRGAVAPGLGGRKGAVGDAHGVAEP